MRTIAHKINSGTASTKDYICKEGMPSFVPITDFPQIMKLVQIGVGGTRKRRWYKSKKLIYFILLCGLIGLYHITPPSIKERAVPLAENGLSQVSAIVSKGLSAAMSYIASNKVVSDEIAKVMDKLPAPMQDFLSRYSLPLPQGLDENTVRAMKQAAGANPTAGVRFASAKTGDDFNPSFLIANNLPDHTLITVALVGKEGTLLNAVRYKDAINVETNHHLALTNRFMYESDKPLPRGEYFLIAYKASEPPADLSKSIIGFYFLGGQKNAEYAQRLKEFNERLMAPYRQEITDLQQTILTLESMADESASSFFDLLNSKANAKVKKTKWATYQKKFRQLSDQVGTYFKKQTQATSTQRLLPTDFYEKTNQIYSLTNELHQLESAYLVAAKPATMSGIKSKAELTLNALSDIKAKLAKAAQK
jgi:hypothetical protein